MNLKNKLKMWGAALVSCADRRLPVMPATRTVERVLKAAGQDTRWFPALVSIKISCSARDPLCRDLSDPAVRNFLRGSLPNLSRKRKSPREIRGLKVERVRRVELPTLCLASMEGEKNVGDCKPTFGGVFL